MPSAYPWGALEPISRAALRVAEACGLPVVVSSAVDTSVGLAAGVALAAALPELPYACGLATMSLYNYVPAKDHLVQLMIDHVNGEYGYPAAPPSDHPALTADYLVRYSESIAEASGGIFGIHRISADERALLTRIAAALKGR